METQSDFQSLALPEALLSSLIKIGFEKPTPIQAQAIPVVLAGKDILASAQTGSGKTGAFLIPILAHLLADPKAQAVVMSPTRELAQQVQEVFRQLTTSIPGMSSVLLIGGSHMDRQIQGLRKNPRIIMATPGRLNDHARRRTVNLKSATIFVLDEADRMLDMGFLPQIQDIIKHLPEKRQTLLFSATFPNEIKRLCQSVLRQPVEVAVHSQAEPPKQIDQTAREVKHEAKNETLLDMLNKAGPDSSALIFTKTQIRCDKLSDYLQSYGVPVACIHGGCTQGQRNRALQGFRNGTYKVLVATDIAARGIDVPHVAYVYNFDLPQTVEDYVHRIGRTGRAGKSGAAISLVSSVDMQMWNDIARKFQLPMLRGQRRDFNGGERRDFNGGGARTAKSYARPTENKPFRPGGYGHKGKNSAPSYKPSNGAPGARPARSAAGGGAGKPGFFKRRRPDDRFSETY